MSFYNRYSCISGENLSCRLGRRDFCHSTDILLMCRPPRHQSFGQVSPTLKQFRSVVKLIRPISAEDCYGKPVGTSRNRIVIAGKSFYYYIMV